MKDFSFRALLIVVLITISEVKAQDIHFSNYLWAPSVSNSSLIGMRKDFTTVLQTRRQWNSIATPFIYNQLNLSYPLFHKPDSVNDKSSKAQNPWGSAGLALINSTSGPGGVYKVNDISGCFAYNIQLSSANVFTASLQPVFVNKSYSLTHLTTGSQYTSNGFDPSIANGESSTSYSTWNFNLSSAFLWHGYKASRLKYYSGVAFYNLLKSEDEIRTTKRFSYIGGMTLYENESFIIRSDVQWMRQAKSNNIIAGADVLYKFKTNKSVIKYGTIGAGLHHRLSDALIFSAQLDQPSYTVGMSYDIVTSSLDRNIRNANSIELYLCFKIKVKRKPIEKKLADSPVIKENTDKSTIVHLYAFDQTDSTAVNVLYTLMELNPHTGEELYRETIEDTLHLLKLNLPQNHKFQVQAGLPGFVSSKEVLNIDNKDTTIQHFYLTPFEPGSVFTLNDIRFTDNHSDIEILSRDAIIELSNLMKSYPELKIEVTGHSDDKGSDNVNLKLSEARAQKIKDLLIREGIDESRIKVKGKGRLKPLENSKEESVRMQNRRIEIKIVQ